MNSRELEYTKAETLHQAATVAGITLPPLRSIHALGSRPLYASGVVDCSNEPVIESLAAVECAVMDALAALEHPWFVCPLKDYARGEVDWHYYEGVSDPHMWRRSRDYKSRYAALVGACVQLMLLRAETNACLGDLT